VGHLIQEAATRRYALSTLNFFIVASDQRRLPAYGSGEDTFVMVRFLYSIGHSGWVYDNNRKKNRARGEKYSATCEGFIQPHCNEPARVNRGSNLLQERDDEISVVEGITVAEKIHVGVQVAVVHGSTDARAVQDFRQRERSMM